MKKLLKTLLIACTFVLAFFAIYSLPSRYYAVSAADKSIPGDSWAVSSEDFWVSSNGTNILFNSNYYYTPGNAATTRIYMETKNPYDPAYTLANGSHTSFYVEYKTNDGVLHGRDTGEAIEVVPVTDREVYFEIKDEAGAMGATYYVKWDNAGNTFHIGTSYVEYTDIPFVFSAFPKLNEIENANYNPATDKYEFYAGSVAGNSLVLPYITYNPNLYYIEYAHGIPTKTGESCEEVPAGDGINNILYFKNIGEYTITYYQKTFAAGETWERAGEQKLAFYGAKAMIDNEHPEEFLKFTSATSFATAEVALSGANAVTTKAQADARLLLSSSNPLAVPSTNRTDVWFNYYYLDNHLAANNPEVIYQTRVTGRYYYKPSRDTQTWTEKTFDARDGFSLSGIYFVEITLTTTQTVGTDTTTFLVQRQNFLFEIKNTNPIYWLTTQKERFKTNGDGTEFYEAALHSGGYTNNRVNFECEEYGLFDIEPTFFYYTVGNAGDRSKWVEMELDAMRKTTIPKAGTDVPEYAEFMVRAVFGMGTAEEQSHVVTRFTIDTTAVNLNPLRVTYDADPQTKQVTEGTALLGDSLDGTMTQEQILTASKTITATEYDFKIFADKNTATPIVTKQMRYVLFDEFAYAKDDVSAVTDLGDGTYVSALLKGAARTNWADFNVNSKFTKAGFYEFRFMDAASNVAYYYIYIDTVDPNLIYDHGTPVPVAEQTPGDVGYEYIRHNVYYGQYKAVRLPGELSGLRNDYLTGSPIEIVELGSGEVGYYLITPMQAPVISEQLMVGGNEGFSDNTGELSKYKNNNMFFVGENRKANEGTYIFSVRDARYPYTKEISGKITVDYDLANVQIIPSKGNDSASDYYEGKWQSIKQGNGNSASGTNFDVINLSATIKNTVAATVGNRPAFDLDSIFIKYTAPKLSGTNLYAADHSASCTCGETGPEFDHDYIIEVYSLGNTQGVINTTFNLPTLNNGGGYKTHEGKYELTRKLVDDGLNTIAATKDIDGISLYDIEATYEFYVDRSAVLDKANEIGADNEVVFFGGKQYRSQDKKLNINTAGFNTIKDEFGEINEYGSNISANSNLVTASLNKQDKKYGSKTGQPLLYNLNRMVYLGNALQTDTIYTDAAIDPQDKISKPFEAFAQKGIYNVVLSDGLNASIMLSNGTKILGNANAFSFAINHDAPKGSVSADPLSDTTTVTAFDKTKPFAIVTVDEETETHITNQTQPFVNTIFLKEGEKGQNFNFVVDNKLELTDAYGNTSYTNNLFAAIINFDRTQLNDTIIGTNNTYQKRTADGTRQIITLPRTAGAIYRITLEYYDDAAEPQLSSFSTAEFRIIIDGEKPVYNLSRVQNLDDYYQAAKTQISFGSDYFYILPGDFKFRQAGNWDNINTYADTNQIYYRKVTQAIAAGIDPNKPTVFEGDNWDNSNPKFDTGAAWFKKVYRPFNYAPSTPDADINGISDLKYKNFKDIAGTGLFEIIEIDAAGNATSYFVCNGTISGVLNNIVFTYQNYVAGDVNANGSQKLGLQDGTVTSGNTQIPTFNTVATTIANFNFDVFNIDCIDKYFKIEIADTTYSAPGAASYSAYYVHAATNADLKNAITSHINYNSTWGNQITVRILDRTSLPGGGNSTYFAFVLNISPLVHTEVVRDQSPVFENIIKLHLPTPATAYYNSYNINAGEGFKCGRMGDNGVIESLTFNPNGELPLGTYLLTYQNNYGLYFSHYISTVDESAYFDSSTGSQTYNGKQYYGDGLSFYFSNDAYTFETLTVTINGEANTYTMARLGEFATSEGLKTVAVNGRPVLMQVYKFKQFKQAEIEYSVQLAYKAGIGNAATGSRPSEITAVYYTKMPPIEIKIASDVLEDFYDGVTIRTTSAVLQSFVPTPAIPSGEDILFAPQSSLRISSVGINFDGTSEPIATNLAIMQGYKFTLEGTKYKRIEYTLTFSNLLGMSQRGIIIIDNEQHPTYQVIKGSTVLRASSKTADISAGSLINDPEFAGGISNCKLFFSNDPLETVRIVLAEDKPDLVLTRIDNRLPANNFEIYKISTPTLTELIYIKITYVSYTSSLSGLALSPNSANVPSSAGQNTIEITYNPNGYPGSLSPGNNYYGLEYYAAISIYDFYTIETGSKISLSSTGVYSISYFDLAGNVHEITPGVTTQTVTLINNVAVSVSSPNYTGELYNDMVFENSATFTVLNQSLYFGTLSMTVNGKTMSNSLSNYTISTPGVYDIVYTGDLNGTTRKTGAYRVFIVRPNEQRAGLGFVLSNRGDAANQNIKEIWQRDVSQLSGKGEDRTLLFRIKAGLSGQPDALLKRAILSEYESGNGYFTITVNIDSLSVYKKVEPYTFHVLINNNAPIITSNVKLGSKTSKKAYIYCVPSVMYKNYGNVALYINGEKVAEFNEFSINNNYQNSWELSMGTNIIELTSTDSDKTIIFNRYTIVRTAPLTLISVVVIIVGSGVLIAAIIIFLRLRTKMKVR